MRSASLLRVRVRVHDRVRDRARRARAAARRRAERRRAQGLRHAVGRASRSTSCPGFDIFVGPEALIADGLAHGRAWAPSPRSRRRFRARSSRSCASRRRGRRPAGRAARVRRAVPAPGRPQAPPRRSRACPSSEDVRAPLRSLTVDERDELDAWAESVLDSGTRPASSPRRGSVRLQGLARRDPLSGSDLRTMSRTPRRRPARRRQILRPADQLRELVPERR